MKKPNMTKIKQIEHFQTRVHTFCLLMPIFTYHLKSIMHTHTHTQTHTHAHTNTQTHTHTQTHIPSASQHASQFHALTSKNSRTNFGYFSKCLHGRETIADMDTQPFTDNEQTKTRTKKHNQHGRWTSAKVFKSLAIWEAQVQWDLGQPIDFRTSLLNIGFILSCGSGCISGNGMRSPLSAMSPNLLRSRIGSHWLSAAATCITLGVKLNFAAQKERPSKFVAAEILYEISFRPARTVTPALQLRFLSLQALRHTMQSTHQQNCGIYFSRRRNFIAGKNVSLFSRNTGELHITHFCLISSDWHAMNFFWISQ